jgi:hypothetical protein
MEIILREEGQSVDLKKWLNQPPIQKPAIQQIKNASCGLFILIILIILIIFIHFSRELLKEGIFVHKLTTHGKQTIMQLCS